MSIMSTDQAEVRRVAELLCNCAKSRKSHSVYCPAYTSLPRLGAALASHRARMLNA